VCKIAFYEKHRKSLVRHIETMLFVAFPPETDRLRRTTIYRFDAQANQQLAISQLALGTGAKDDRWRPAERTQAPS